MAESTLLAAILDSLTEPIIFADTEHMTRFMNKAAIAYYSGGADLIGRSMLDCHNPESQRKIIDILATFKAGENECLYKENEKKRSYMRAVRDSEGHLLGYYEWFVYKI
jgi:DUF438 domain-containing protein